MVLKQAYKILMAQLTKCTKPGIRYSQFQIGHNKFFELSFFMELEKLSFEF